MGEFFRFPSTPHLHALGNGVGRDDKLLSPEERERLLSAPVIIEEKLDGANVGLSLAPDGSLRAQNRGHYLDRPFRGQFSRLSSWLPMHEAGLRQVLSEEIILFGEWCAATHSVEYSALTDLFFLFDVFDIRSERFWSAQRRDGLADEAGLQLVPTIGCRTIDLDDLLRLIEDQRSRFADAPIEGVVVRRDEGPWNADRGKLVRSDFTQSISDHWSKKTIRWNRLAPGRG